jgi:hypothetical protein
VAQGPAPALVESAGLDTPAGSALGPYSILSLLGAGGMGEKVYRARDPRLGREVAIKVVSGESVTDPARRARVEPEARAAAALNHPHILAVYDVGTAEVAGVPTIPPCATIRIRRSVLRRAYRLGEAARFETVEADVKRVGEIRTRCARKTIRTPPPSARASI